MSPRVVVYTYTSMHIYMHTFINTSIYTCMQVWKQAYVVI